MDQSSITAMTAEQGSALCHRPEDQFYDRKSSLSKGKTAQKIAVAFANAEGGEITFGIKDDKEESDPKKKFCLYVSPEDANDTLHNIYSLNPPVTFRYSFHRVDGQDGFLLRVFVDKTQHVHCTNDGNTYRRFGGEQHHSQRPQ